MVRPDDGGRGAAVTASLIGAASSSVAGAWTQGPTLIYSRLAEVLLATSAVPFAEAPSGHWRWSATCTRWRSPPAHSTSCAPICLNHAAGARRRARDGRGAVAVAQARRRPKGSRSRRRSRRPDGQAPRRGAQDRRPRSPLTFTWRNTEQLDGDLVAAVTALEQDSSIRRIALNGSVSIVRQLLDAVRLELAGVQKIPRDGPVIAVFNHRSYFAGAAGGVAYAVPGGDW